MKRLFLLLLTIFLSLSALSQTTLTGRITDAHTNEPLIGATIAPKSSKELGAVTDVN